ncbi:Uncharacterised protein [uncultured archaeon]|nr:Uncharacterised protein [uncultured archaeon]
MSRAISFPKTCTTCNEPKPESDFYRRKDGKCKKCQNVYRNKFHRKVYAPLQGGKKKCATCEVIKDITEFYISRKMPGCRQNACKSCNDARRDRERVAKKITAPMYKPSRKPERYTRAQFITIPCAVCDKPFEPTSSVVKRCGKACTLLVNRFYTRGIRNLDYDTGDVAVSNATQLARIWLRSTHCIYCGDPFVESGG